MRKLIVITLMAGALMLSGCQSEDDIEQMKLELEDCRTEMRLMREGIQGINEDGVMIRYEQ